jgi:hypothetical protein
MKVTLFEVCRSPEILKANTEAIVLSECFASLGIEFELYTNDGFWADRPKSGSTISRDIIQNCLDDPKIDVVHFAVHGDPKGLVLEFDDRPISWQRSPTDVLTGAQIRGMTGFRHRLVVSGACGSAFLAEDFLAAGATAFVAPDIEIPWRDLGIVFHAFYASLKAGLTAEVALGSALSGHPRLADSYRVYS